MVFQNLLYFPPSFNTGSSMVRIISVCFYGWRLHPICGVCRVCELAHDHRDHCWQRREVADSALGPCSLYSRILESDSEILNYLGAVLASK